MNQSFLEIILLYVVLPVTLAVVCGARWMQSKNYN
jgi:hypothetical protein